MNELAYYTGDLCPDRLKRQLELGYSLDWLYTYDLTPRLKTTIVALLNLEVNVSYILSQYAVLDHIDYAGLYYVLNECYQYEDRVKKCHYALKSTKGMKRFFTLQTLATLKLLGIANSDITDDFLRVLANYSKSVDVLFEDVYFLIHNQEKLSLLKNNIKRIETMQIVLNVENFDLRLVLKELLLQRYPVRQDLDIKDLADINRTLIYKFDELSPKRFLQYLKQNNYLKEN